MWVDLRDFITDFASPVGGQPGIRRSRRRKWRLGRTLNNGQWQDLDALRDSIHWDDDEHDRNAKTHRILTSIGARSNGANLWSLGVPIVEFGQ